MPATLPPPPVRPVLTLSTEVKNILDAPPIWLVRWGSLLLLGGILVLLGAAGFVRYPRVITGQVALYAGSQLTAIALPAGATDYTLRVQPGQTVEAGQLLAIVRQGKAERALSAPTAGIVEAPAAPGGRVVLRLRPTAHARRSTITLAAPLGRRVRVGQRVLISLNAFPSNKFGQLTGHVVRPAQPAGANQATVTVVLDQGYRSTHGTLLPVAGLSQGTAQIITTDKHVLEHLLHL
ncbi:biotin/lipoyl-containing protein [Hymenobacter algoricola]|uniref:Lipoyl-binding domain-containing protein n=1 Tax=Hymenobacter algoricola TaxID=486267 RepID=A0ABP7NTB9_9BACT